MRKSITLSRQRMPAPVSSQLRQEVDLFFEQREGGETLRIWEQYAQHGQELGMGMKIGELTENLRRELLDSSKPFLPRLLHRTQVDFQARQDSLLEKLSRS